MSMKRFFGNSQYGGRTVFHGILVGKPNKNSLVLELLKGSIQLMDHQSKPHIIWVGYLQQFNITGEGEIFFTIQRWILSTMWTCQAKYLKKS